MQGDLGTRSAQVLGRYQLVRQIGKGGMGTVYEAYHPILKKRFAIKTLLEPAAAIPDARARFLREAEAAARINHPNVVHVSDVGTEGNTPYLVMEYLEGQTLARLLATEGRLAVAQALDLLLPVVSAVAAAHALGVIDRDLKPENIFLAQGPSGDLCPKVVDFGISKLTDDGPSTLTGPQAMLGTAAYMSPEQARGAREVSHASDQYALGLILYEMLSGARAHPGQNALEILHNISSRAIVRLRHLRPDCPQALEDIVMRMLSPAPEYRFPRLLDAGSALLELASEKTRSALADGFGNAARPALPTGAPRPSVDRSDLTTQPAAKTRPRRAWLWAAVLVGIALLAVLFHAWQTSLPGQLLSTPSSAIRKQPDLPPAVIRPLEATPAATPLPDPAVPPNLEPRARTRRTPAVVPGAGKAEEKVFDRSHQPPARPRRGVNDALIIE